MTDSIRATEVTLHDLKTKFGLQLVEDDKFFSEWQTNLPEVTSLDKQFLDRIKAGYVNLIEYPPMLENTVKLVVLAPLLHIAGFYLPPFYIKTENSVRIVNVDEGIIVEGKLDVLVLKEQFWVMVIESKQAAYSIEAGLAQLLAYMLANPQAHQVSFGMITTGGSFIFVKVVKSETPQYALSRIFELRNPGNELYTVLSILKQLGQTVLD
jgi:hypothetical protein